ncbi:glycosyltransferase family 2 protein [Rossellomorea vietnamensis]|uniref:glycosyltransferase family 2 protein n=1 Tax=Rossellomorea vietnamensis TaxID=218284 RepID=UPI003CF41B51
MTLLYITFAVFLSFVLFQTLYVLIPLFKDENKHKNKITKMHSFSVIVPAYNEEKVIENCIGGFNRVAYEDAELLIVNDGSKDRTLEVLNEALLLKPATRMVDTRLKHERVTAFYQSQKYPSIFVINKKNGGKADSLNAGINFSEKEVVITLDADSILEKNSLNEMNSAFQRKGVVACGGNVLISQAFNGSLENLKPTLKVNNVIKFQFLQYLSSFYLHKRAQAAMNSITVIAGAFGAFRRETLFGIKGFRKTVGEDMDITLKLHKWIKERGNKESIIFVPTALCYTECPSTLKNMFKQRVRWQKAFIDCLIYYRKDFFRKLPKTFSVFFLVDQFMIGTLSAFPVLLTPLMLYMNGGQLTLLLMLMSGAFLLFIYQSLTTMFVSYLHGLRFSKKDLLRFLLFLPVDIIVFRMLINLSFVVYGTLSYFHSPHAWDKLERSGKVAWKGVERA